MLMRRVAVFMNVPVSAGDDSAIATTIECALDGNGWDTDPTVYGRDEDILGDMEAGEEATGPMAAEASLRKRDDLITRLRREALALRDTFV